MQSYLSTGVRGVRVTDSCFATTGDLCDLCFETADDLCLCFATADDLWCFATTDGLCLAATDEVAHTHSEANAARTQSATVIRERRGMIGSSAADHATAANFNR